jgi:putative heme-binding domain-containing protein
VRETPREKTRLIASYRQRLTPAALSAGDRVRGRALFVKLCANCHQLFGEGAAIGPDLTGAQRTNIDYLLLNLVDPSSSISRDFQMEVVETAEGRIVTGLVVGESDHAITVQTPNEKVVLPRAEIDRRVESGVSMMPEGLLQPLAPEEIRDLFAYLMGERQTSSASDSGRVGETAVGQ